MKEMTEERILSLGYEKVKEYTHDEWIAKRYTKGKIECELTHTKEGAFDSFGFHVVYEWIDNITPSEFESIDKILNK